MAGMFDAAVSFNGDITSWDTTGVKTMDEMFTSAVSFNRDISGWPTSKNLESMQGMFKNARSFNQDLSRWTFPTIEIAGKDMFENASSSTCTWDAPGMKIRDGKGTRGRVSIGRIYCGDLLKDGASCAVDEACDSTVCGSGKCCQYSAGVEQGCSVCSNKGSCISPPTVTTEWRDMHHPSLDFPARMTIGESKVVCCVAFHYNACVCARNVCVCARNPSTTGK